MDCLLLVLDDYPIRPISDGCVPVGRRPDSLASRDFVPQRNARALRDEVPLEFCHAG
ncbi:MAG: hypothetical protein WD771_08815 [Gemmatimonadaceae bacterium]